MHYVNMFYIYGTHTHTHMVTYICGVHIYTRRARTHGCALKTYSRDMKWCRRVRLFSITQVSHIFSRVPLFSCIFIITWLIIFYKLEKIKKEVIYGVLRSVVETFWHAFVHEGWSQMKSKYHHVTQTKCKIILSWLLLTSKSNICKIYRTCIKNLYSKLRWRNFLIYTLVWWCRV